MPMLFTDGDGREKFCHREREKPHFYLIVGQQGSLWFNSFLFPGGRQSVGLPTFDDMRFKTK